jgi:hypothetical protein
MRIAELKIQPNWILTVIAEDGRIGYFDVVPTLKTKHLKLFKTKVNSQKSSMVVTLLHGTVELICRQTPLKRNGGLLVIPI